MFNAPSASHFDTTLIENDQVSFDGADFDDCSFVDINCHNAFAADKGAFILERHIFGKTCAPGDCTLNSFI